MNKKGLGKGLGAIFTDNETIAPVEEVQPHEKEIEIAVSDIIPNPLQPRKTFDADKLAELTESIKEHGVIQPLIVRKNGAKYEIVAGERRWRAAKTAKLKTVPVIVREYDNAKMAEIALVENIQRHDLNAIEEAEGIKRLMNEFGFNQEQAAKKIGRSRTAVTNILRLLNLPAAVREAVSRETLTMGQVRPLLSLEKAQEQEKLAQIIAEQGLSARAVEEIVKKIKNGEEITFENDAEQTKKAKETRKNKKTEISIYCRDFQNRLIELLGTKVKIVPKNEKQGKIEIEYYSAEDLERIYELLEQQPKQNKIKREKFTV